EQRGLERILGDLAKPGADREKIKEELIQKLAKREQELAGKIQEAVNKAEMNNNPAAKKLEEATNKAVETAKALKQENLDRALAEAKTTEQKLKEAEKQPAQPPAMMMQPMSGP